MNTSVESQELERTPLTERELELLHAYWRACNYLAVGMIYLQDNPLLQEPLQIEHVKAGCSATGAPAPRCRSSGRT